MNSVKIILISLLILTNFTLNADGADINLPAAGSLIKSSLENYLITINFLSVVLLSDLIPRETIIGILKDFKARINTLKLKVNNLLKKRGGLEVERELLRAVSEILNNLEMMIDSLINQLDNPKDKGAKKTYYYQFQEKVETKCLVI